MPCCTASPRSTPPPGRVCAGKATRHLGLQRLSPASFQHARTVTGGAVQLEQRSARLEGGGGAGDPPPRAPHGPAPRLHRAHERLRRPAGPHRPDLALLDGDGRVVAVEVELTPKAPRTARARSAADGPAHATSSTPTTSPPPPSDAHSNAPSTRHRAEDRITIHPLDHTDALAAALNEGVESCGNSLSTP